MKRIAMISEHASPLALLSGHEYGGQHVYVANTSLLMAQKGIDIDVYTRRESADVPEIVEISPGFRVIHIDAGPAQQVANEKLLPCMDEFALNMLRFIEREQLQYDLIHAHFFMSSWVAYQLKRWLHLPYAVTFHELGKVRRAHQGVADQFPDERLGIEAVTVQDADMIVAECPQDLDDLVTLYSGDRQKIRLIPGGFDPKQFQPLPKRYAAMKVNLDPSKRYVLNLGRMVQRKGVETVLRGFSHLVGTNEGMDDVRLLIVGGETEDADPSLTSEIGRLSLIAESLEILDRVLFIGKRDQDVLHYYYNAADVFVTTPWYEPFGLTPLEAMACSKPVIGSKVGGIQYSVIHEETGLLVPPKNPLAVAKALHKLLTNPQYSLILGKQGRKRVSQFFTWELVVNNLLRMYSQMLKEEQMLFHQEPLLAHQNRERLYARMIKGGRVRRVAMMQTETQTQRQPWYRRMWHTLHESKAAFISRLSTRKP